MCFFVAKTHVLYSISVFFSKETDLPVCRTLIQLYSGFVSRLCYKKPTSHDLVAVARFVWVAKKFFLSRHMGDSLVYGLVLLLCLNFFFCFFSQVEGGAPLLLY